MSYTQVFTVGEDTNAHRLQASSTRFAVSMRIPLAVSCQTSRSKYNGIKAEQIRKKSVRVAILDSVAKQRNQFSSSDSSLAQDNLEWKSSFSDREAYTIRRREETAIEKEYKKGIRQNSVKKHKKVKSY